MDTVMEMVMEIDKRHGGPYDRGSADKYYNRMFNPHYFVGATYSSECVIMTDPETDEYKQYAKGYNDQVETKDWS